MAVVEVSLPDLRPYVPDLLLTWQPSHGDHRHMQVEGSLAFVDISGFTKLTERLARKGKVGAEEMSDLLNSTFAALLGEARPHGADLVKWGGDAVLLLFRGEDHAGRACRAAYDMRETLRTVGRLHTTSGDVTLRMSVGVHSGFFDFYLAGDPDHHRELLVVGPEASTTAVMEAAASAGQIAVSDQTAALLPAGSHRPGPFEGARLLRVRPDGPPRPLPGPRRPSEERLLEQFLPPVLRAQVLSEPGEAEHRTVSVAFVRFSGTDELARTGGVAAVAEALDQCVRAVQSATREHGVTFFETDIDRDGGKIMLVAGAPRSRGQDEDRMLRAVRAVMDRAGALDLRIGVNRGAVFAGDFGPAFRRTYSIKGDAVNLAARVMGKAAPGEVLATVETVDRSSTEFETSPLEPFLVKGKTRPIIASRIGAVVGTRARRRSATTFVGRTAELTTLSDAFARAADGAGSHVEIVGEPGIGKSRLITEALATAPESPRVVSAACGEYELSTPYVPVRTLMRAALGMDATTSSRDTAERLREVTAEVAPDLLPWLPLLGIPLDVNLPPTRESSDLDAQFRKSRLEESVDALLGKVLTGPTVLVLEDTHLMDDASADLVRRLAHSAAGRPWVLLVTRREVPGGYVPPAGVDVTTIRPGTLSPEDALAMVRAATAGLPLTHEALSLLATRAGGNPMFLEELAQVAGRSGSVNDLPESVQDLVTSQIDRLSPLDRTTLRYAAVLGMVADPRLLEQLLSEHRGDTRIEDRLTALEDFLDRDREGQLRFRHSLMRDVAYEGLPYRRRRVLHEQVGLTIERSARRPERLSETLSLHFFQAERFDRAWTYSRLAGLRAQEKYANAEAIDFFQRAVEASRRATGVPAEDVAAVWESLGDVQELAGRSAAAVVAFRQARRLREPERAPVVNLMYKEARIAQRLGKVSLSLGILTRAMRRLDGDADPGALGSRSRLATRYAWGRLTQRRYADALRWATSAARDAEDSGDKSVLAHAYNGLHYAHHYSGVPAEVPYGRLALHAYEELGDLAGQGHSATTLGIEALDAGRLDEALDFFRRATAMFGRLGDAANEANATYNQADVLLREERYAEAEPLLLDALSIARAVRDEELVALVLRETGRVHAGLGRPDDAARHLEDARTLFVALGLTEELPLVEAALAELGR